MQISGAWLEAEACQKVLAQLSRAGHQAYAVGGCVRNTLLDAPVADVDIATDALPEQVSALARAAGMKVIPTGIDHGTVTVVCAGVPFEITTFRRDVETDGRRAVVAFARDITEDASRRDFTMNALYVCADGRVVDPLGTGIADALQRHIRFVGTPEARIREDYLRILRFFRFYAWYGSPDNGPDAEGLAACAALAEGIDSLSRERIGAEMRKLLAAPDPAPALAAMQASNVLSRCLPGADAKAVSVLVHLENGSAPRWTRRLAVLGGDALADRLRLSRAEAETMALLREAVQDGPSAAVLGYLLGADRAEDAILARAALIEMAPPLGWQEEVARGVASRFPITAADLMPAFEGVALGAKLKALKAQWLASDLWLSRADLLQGRTP